MKVRLYLGLCLMVFCLSEPGILQADILNSQAGLGLCVYDNGGVCSISGSSVAVTPHPLWQPNNPVNPGDSSDQSAVWISYKRSGYDQDQFQPYQGTNPIFRLTWTFVTGASAQLILHVWADDTAGVFLDGSPLMLPVFTQSICSGQSIGCRPQDSGDFKETLGAGTHSLAFDVYQVGNGTDTHSNPMGLLYTGTVQAVPEPTALVLTALMGSLVFGMRVLRRRA